LDALPFKEAKVFECAHEINSTSVRIQRLIFQ